MTLPDKLKARDPAQDLAAEAARLRDLIRQAHEAVKDLRSAIREAHRVADTAEATARAAIDARITLEFAELQRNQNQAAADLNAAVDRARRAIVDGLSTAEIEHDDTRDVFVLRFRGCKFDTDPRPELTGGQPLPAAKDTANDTPLQVTALLGQDGRDSGQTVIGPRP